MIKAQLQREGYLLLKKYYPQDQLAAFRIEADRVSTSAKSACVRNLTRHSEIFSSLASSLISKELIPTDYRLVRSILFNKTPDQNWPVPWHQDLTITVTQEIETDGYGPWSIKDGTPHVQPPTDLLSKMMTVRIHLDDTPASNGALRVIPESHRLGKIPSNEVSQYTGRPAITCEAAPGDTLLMSPLILHASSRSESPGNRRILHFEFAPKNALHPQLSWADECTSLRSN